MRLRFFAILILCAVAVFASCKKDESDLSKDKKVIKAYLVENGIDAQEYKNVYYVVLEEGSGAQCKGGDKVACKYRLTTVDHPDKVIDQTDVHAFQCDLPEQVPTGYGIIPGFQIALTTMKEGGKSVFYIPAALAYGNDRFGDDDRANLIYEIELCEIISNGAKH